MTITEEKNEDVRRPFHQANQQQVLLEPNNCRVHCICSKFFSGISTVMQLKFNVSVKLFGFFVPVVMKCNC